MKYFLPIILFASLQSFGQELTETKSTFENFDQIRDLQFLNETDVMATATTFNNGNIRTVLTRFNNGVAANNAIALASAGMNSLGSTSITASGDLLLSGMADLGGNSDPAPTVMKITPDGSVLWTSSFAGEVSSEAKDVYEMENGELTGINSNLPLSQSTFFRMQSDGSLVEQKELFIDGAPAALLHHQYLGNQTSIYAGVYPEQDSGDLLSFVAKLVDGSVEWCKAYDLGLDLSESAGPDFLMEVAEDGGIYLAATHKSDTSLTGDAVSISRLNSEGEVDWSYVSEVASTAAMGLFLEAMSSGDALFGFSYNADEEEMILSQWSDSGELIMLQADNTVNRLLTEIAEKEDLTFVMAGVNPNEEDSYVVEMGPFGELPCGSEDKETIFGANTITVEDKATEIVPVATATIEGSLTTLVVAVETEEVCAIILGTEDQASAFYALYPNPATDEVTISFKSPGVHQVTIFNALGRIVSESTLTGESGVIDISALSKGVYLIKSGSQTRRIIKE